MRLKQTGALLLASAMIVGSVGIMNPTEVRAAGETNTFTLTVPADTSITQSGWNDIGNVGVSNVSIESGKKISVTIENGATGRTLKKTGDASKTVGYEVKKGTSASNEAFGTSLEFEANGTQALGAVVADFSTAEVGTYEDTINFTAELKSAGATLADVMTTGAKCKLSVWQSVENKMMEFKYEKKDTGFEVVDVTLGDESIKSSLGSMCISQVVDTHTIKLGIMDNFDLTINVSNGTYTFRDAGFGMFEYRSFAVQPAGETEFTDITLTPASAPTAADVFKENAELVMKLVEANGSFFVLTYKNIGGSFVVQSIISSENGDITSAYGSACSITNNNPSFTFIFGIETDTMTLNTSTLEYTRTGNVPEMTSFVVDGVELIDTLTDKTNTAEPENVKVSSRGIEDGMEIERNDLVLNAGDTWDDAVAANEGKKLVISYYGDTYELTLDKVNMFGADRVMLVLDGAPMCFFFAQDPSFIEYESIVDFYTEYALKATDTVPEVIWFELAAL